jgi:hypothetical protein
MDYAQAILPLDFTGFAPIQIEMGYLPRTSFDWNNPKEPHIVREKLSREEAQEFVKRLANVWFRTRDNIKKAQESMII